MSAMKTEWDYSRLAKSYVDRVDYASTAIQKILNKIENSPQICDVGAGVGHLTKLLSPFAFSVDAVEPNDSMREIGIKLLGNLTNVTWHEGIAEATGMKSGVFDLVTFGSSFNVCNQQLALKESYRLLKIEGFFVCMWNLRDLNDPLQVEIEKIINSSIPDYSYGNRRQDQTKVIKDSNLFKNIEDFQERITHKVSAEQFINAWSSHATLQRQSGTKFEKIIKDIAECIRKQNTNTLEIPYNTVVYMAQKF
jgi:ubiquinone/menaquinone biosynthesis C-methylase UbiE